MANIPITYIPMNTIRQICDAQEEIASSSEISEENDPQLTNVQPEKQESINDSREHIIEPYKSIGVVCDSVPFVFHKNDRESLITQSVSHAFQRIEIEHMRVIYQSEQLPYKITAIAIKGDYTYAAAYSSHEGGFIYSFKRVHKLGTLISNHKSEFTSMLIGGDMLYALDTNGELFGWNFVSKGECERMMVNASAKRIMHLPTYLNKIIAYGGNQMILYNVRSKSTIYSFPNISAHIDSDITSIVEAPIVDIAAISLANGKVMAINVKTDQIISQFCINQPITSLSFSSDPSLWTSLLIIGTNNGALYLWDMNKNVLLFKKEAAHLSDISQIYFLPKEPIFVTSSGNDNSMRKWKIEGTHFRLLTQRAGHPSFPEYIRFYNDMNIISFSSDGILREQNLYKQGICHSYSNREASVPNNPKLKHFAFNEFREGFWGNIIAAFSNSSSPISYYYDRKASTPVKMQTEQNYDITAITTSHCGTFGLVGYSNGCIEKINMQSGNKRGEMKRHTKDITSIMCDDINIDIISTSIDGKIITWDFDTCKYISEINVHSAILKAVYNSDKGVFATADQLFAIKIYNFKTKETVRELGSHQSQVTDMCFTQYGKRLLTCSMDKTIKVWDIAFGMLIDWIEFDKAPLSLDISPSEDVLASSHIGVKGIQLWVYKSNEILISTVPEKPTHVKLQHNIESGEFLTDKMRKDYYIEKENEQPADQTLINAISLENHNKDTVVSTDLPITKWLELTDIEESLERNKPIVKKTEPPVPFFLFDLNEALEGNKQEDISKEQTKKAAQKEQIFNLLLKQFSETEGKNASEIVVSIVKYMKEAPPKKLYAEIKELAPFYNMGSYTMVIGLSRWKHL